MDRSVQPRVNVADRLAEAARERPNAIALATPAGRDDWRTISLGELDSDATIAARGLATMGVGPGKRIALLVKPGVEFVTLVFALLRTGATMVLVDAGLGRKNIVRCLASTEPDGFVAIPLGHALRVVKRKQFAKAKLNVTVGRQWFWGGETLESVKRLGESAIRHPQSAIAHTIASDPAAIVFTSGSTGPPKGVLYTHETFVTQCAMIQAEYDIRPGDIDLACFPLFGLFNVACGVTAVLPDMDFSRPASCDPKKILAAANEWKVTQAFASPAVWDRVSRYCESTGERIPTLKKILSCGAPVPAKVLRRTLACVHPDAQMHTPYGATEALPIATIEAKEILGETAAKTDEGAGVCVGRKFGTRDGGRGTREDAGSIDGEPPTAVGGGTFDWRVIRIDGPEATTIDEVEELPAGMIGELIVRGPQVSKAYTGIEAGAPIGHPEEIKDRNVRSQLKQMELELHAGKARKDHWEKFEVLVQQLSLIGHNRGSKLVDGEDVWHRTGDAGYFDEQGRFWYCGRKSQRIALNEGALYTECIEAIFNTHPQIARSALVGVYDIHGCLSEVVVVVEPLAVEGMDQQALVSELHELAGRNDISSGLSTFLVHPKLPTDIRHNSKIRREELAVWAAKELAKQKKGEH
jgi:acyl-CoA synthetase (AMP-forming)/AMP-acid ligase II